MKRWRLIALGFITALILLLWNRAPWDMQPQATTPTLLLSAKAQSPEDSPVPSVEASPEDSPVPSVEASPEDSPAPEAVTSPKVSPTNQQFKAVTLPLGDELYGESRFEIGILEGYKVSKVGGVPLIESADGNLAYTVVVKPQLNSLPFSNEALAQLAIEEFERGEGFQPGELRANAPSVVSLSWSGTLTQGRNTKPITGEILARQSGSNIFLLLISATEDKASEVPAAMATLSDSLNPL
ncbi:MAG: hypothetical protein SXA11_19370 [Cyanobacteriota bacterium]|nr:hypothetical protein [Cyanobacteriota bacterium]